MKPFLCVILGVILVLSVGYGAHDLTCYEMIEPGGDYVQADSAIIPKLGIANLGDEAELNFPVEFLAINQEEEDTVFADTTIVDYIMPYPDSIEVEFEEWVPEGLCDAIFPFVEYELIGFLRLGEVGPDESDHCPENDTIRHNVACLLTHDVGVVGIELDGCWPPPDPGTEITITATVENFGYHMEHDIPVRCEIRDRSHGANDSLIYLNRQPVFIIDWRGNPDDNPYTTEITFPVWTYPGDRSMSIECLTEMEGDDCPDNDFEVLDIISVEEARNAPRIFGLEVPRKMTEDNCSIRFTVPHSSWVKLDVFDVNGRWVKSITNDIFEAGHYSCSWNGCDAAGRKAATGVYLIRMQADEFKAVRKVVVVN